MDGQVITTKGDLERILLNKSMEAKPLSLSLLMSITNNFSHEIGRGGFAVVYKGYVGHREVAVKKLSRNCLDDEKEFVREVQCLMKVKHKNIVRCLGYCSDTQLQAANFNGLFVMAELRQRLLCFEYVPNGTLDKYIKVASGEWGNCYKIIKGVCEGLHHLHEQPIVHRDLTPANILLANNMVPKITDFGISRCFGELQTSHFTSKLEGTWGYIAPEIINRGVVSLKSDIYSLGIIITKILTGGYKGPPKFVEVKKRWSHKLEGSKKDMEQIKKCTELAQGCLKPNPKKRPSAQEIINTLYRTKREEHCIEPGASSHNSDSCKSGIAAAATASGGYRILEEGLGISEIFRESENFMHYVGSPASTLDLPLAEATPLESTVAAMDRLMKLRLHFVIQLMRRRATDPETTARTMKILRQAISIYYAQEAKDVEFEKLGVQNLGFHSKKGEELYLEIETIIASEVQRLCRPLDDDTALADNTLFLQELLTKWDLHISALGRIASIFCYMEHAFIPVNGRKDPAKDDSGGETAERR